MIHSIAFSQISISLISKYSRCRLVVCSCRRLSLGSLHGWIVLHICNCLRNAWRWWLSYLLILLLWSFWWSRCFWRLDLVFFWELSWWTSFMSLFLRIHPSIWLLWHLWFQGELLFFPNMMPSWIVSSWWECPLFIYIFSSFR